MSLKGRISGALKQWDSDDQLTDEQVDELAELASNVVEYAVRDSFSKGTVKDLFGEDE